LAVDIESAPAAAAVVVKIHDLFECVEGAVVHIRRGAGHVAQARRFEHSEPVPSADDSAEAGIGIERRILLPRYSHADSAANPVGEMRPNESSRGVSPAHDGN